MAVKTLDQLKNENSPYGTYGVCYFNLESGVMPEIDDSVGFIGTMDCIHKITIGKDAFTGHDVMLLTGAHDYTKFGVERKKAGGGGEIHIKEGVWLASKCIVLGGVTIGEHSVVGAGSVVTHDVPPY